VYEGTSKNFPLDDFVVGIVWPRNGIVEAVRFADTDINSDDTSEMVITRAVGSGGYLSADAFRYRARSLEWVVSVAALDKAADPIQALIDKVKVFTETKS
jgi:hypothetical protein